MSEHSDQIAKSVLQQFSLLPKAGKPTRSNGQSQYTVLAGVVLERVTDGSTECVALGTGLKCLNFKQLKEYGDVVNDFHAEVVCRRSFKRYLLGQMLRSLENDPSAVFTMATSPVVSDDSADPEQTTNAKATLFQLKPGHYFHLYISQAPCGEASMSFVDSKQTQDQREINEAKRQRFLESTNGDAESFLTHETLPLGASVMGKVIRGRMGYQIRGYPRSKPGRGDADVTTSMSCTDKLSLWSSLGLNGSLVGLLCEQIHLKSIVVEDGLEAKSLDWVINHRVPSSAFQRPSLQLSACSTKFPWGRSALDESSSLPCPGCKHLVINNDSSQTNMKIQLY
jgi:tRNA-specific adenosine deaminase 1